jgi:hypothetical protein
VKCSYASFENTPPRVSDRTVHAEYVDTGWSGAKASRPELNRLMADARKRRFDAQ